MSSRVLSLLRRALRYKRHTGEVSWFFLCVWPSIQPKTTTKQTKPNFFFIPSTDSHWDKLPLELRQTIQWMADRQQAHDRLKRGWEKIHCQGFKDVCQFCQVRLQPRDDSDKTCIDLPQQHCQQCNVSFYCLIYYSESSNGELSLTNNHCTW